jgi:hypothetical protein
MLQLAGDAGFIEEAAGRPGPFVEPLPQHLDRHLAVQDDVGGAVDDAHAATGDLVEQRVAPGGGRRTRRCRIV